MEHLGKFGIALFNYLKRHMIYSIATKVTRHDMLLTELLVKTAKQKKVQLSFQKTTKG